MRATAFLGVLCLGLGASGCGAGLGAALSGDGSAKKVERTPTDLDAVTPRDGQSGMVPVLLKLTLDRREEARLASAQFSLEGPDGPFFDATPVGGLSSDLVPGGAPISGADLEALGQDFLCFAWNSHYDVDRVRSASPTPGVPISARVVLRFVVENTTRSETVESRTLEFFLSQALATTVGGGGVGDGLTGGAAMLAPSALAIDASGDLLVCDTENHRLRRVRMRPDAAEVVVARRMETEAGNGFKGGLAGIQSALGTSMDPPIAVAARGTSMLLVLEDDGAGAQRLRAVDRTSGLISPLLGAEFPNMRDVALHADRSILVLTNNELWRFDQGQLDPFPLGLDLGGGQIVRGFLSASALAVAPDPRSEVVYVAELSFGAPFAEQVLELVDGASSRGVAGGGAIDPTSLTPMDIARTPPLATELVLERASALAADGELLHVAQRTSGCVVSVDRATLEVVAVVTGLTLPEGLACDPNGLLYVLEGGSTTPGSGDAGHRVLLVRDLKDPFALSVEPLVAHESTKEDADALGALASAVDDVVIDQPPT